MKKARRLLLAALIPAVLSPAVHADVKETAHEAKVNVKAAGKKMGEDAREAAHGIGRTAKAFSITSHGIPRTLPPSMTP